jgi:hypothetical protein
MTDLEPVVLAVAEAIGQVLRGMDLAHLDEETVDRLMIQAAREAILVIGEESR